jgi:NhaP-type Na+/H+ and K+/H+ antiporter
MSYSHDLILVCGLLGLVSILLGHLSRRIGAPLLLVFLVIGMLAGEDGPGGIQFESFATSYLIGSIALAVILFEGGLKTDRQAVRLAALPATALATVGILITAALTGIAAHFLTGTPIVFGLLIGAVMAPTDAAAVASLLRGLPFHVPARLHAVLEIESGLNDPMSVFLVLLLCEQAIHPGSHTIGGVATLFLKEMGGGALLGLGGGFGIVMLLKRVRLEASLVPILGLFAVLLLFAISQVLSTSGFLAVFIAGVMVGQSRYPSDVEMGHFIEGLAWLAQIVLFLMLGLLATPHSLTPLIVPSLAIAAVLILVARPLATFVCLTPMGFPWRESGFISWVGLRGGVPIFLTVIPMLEGVKNADVLFGAAFVLVIISLIVQGWTVGPAARLLGIGRESAASAAD